MQPSTLVGEWRPERVGFKTPAHVKLPPRPRRNLARPRAHGGSGAGLYPVTARTSSDQSSQMSQVGLAIARSSETDSGVLANP